MKPIHAWEEGAVPDNPSFLRQAERMLPSPAKRRKTSANTSVPATEQHTDSHGRTTPTTPSRASYLSPTKASLARSHPHLVPIKAAQSLTEPRGRLLRNELLSKKGYLPSQIEKPHTTLAEESRERQIHQDPNAGLQAGHEPIIPPNIASKQSTLKQRQSSAQERLQRESGSPDPLPPPTLVKKANAAPREASRPRSDEPELPPTPVQLGLDAPPERPRGLSSSSPRGSKSGSGRRRVRVLNGQSVTSSPLKQKADQLVMHDLESELERANEAPESQLPIPQAAEEELPEELKARTKTRRHLEIELTRLKGENATLEEALNVNDLSGDMASGDSLVALLKSAARPTTSRYSEFEQEAVDKEKRYPLRNLLAPGNLQLQIKTATKVIRSQAKIIHHISLAAPSPWPSNIFSANFELITNAEDAQVEKVVWTDVLKGHRQAPGIQDELHGWMQERLKSELHRFDIGGLIWGMGQYLNASIERAKTFKALVRKYKATSDGLGSDEKDYEKEESNSKDGTLGEDEAIALSTFLTKSQLSFEAKTDADAAVTTRRSRKSAPKIIAVWKLEPTWHGDIKSVCEIAPSGIPDLAQQAVVELFERVKKVGGFEKGFGAVWDMIMNVIAEGDGGHGKDNELKKGEKKRKRFT